ncbi:MAG: hypothetical protein BGO95_01630 [Micrococcales bacterium 73-13]|nr:MAG: hypothetical protein BGO95_01630 [Micrococcales bacterium 73-13]
MSTARNVAATAVATVAWLAESGATIAVPVYQRQYRWEIGACAQFLEDVRAAADGDERQTHFIGSILSADAGGDSAGSDAAAAELVLIDGQQRITTLMLLVAALRDTAGDGDPALAAQLEAVLTLAGPDGRRTRLRPHRAWAGAFEAVVLGRGATAGEASRFADNYTFFRSQIRPDEVPRIRRGLWRLEHVAITLGPDANAQQIFESLNSTGAPLRDHELIHNYVLMGLGRAEQLAIEDEFWLPIEQATGESIADFFRDYLVLATGREPLRAERAVYDAFRREFPRLGAATLRAHAAEWRDYAEVYRILLQPALAPEPAVAAALARLARLGPTMRPLAMLACRDWMRGAIGADRLVEVLGHAEALLLRRMVVGTPLDRLAARLCRKWADGPAALAVAMARITPSDERIRLALRYRALPLAGAVLERLERVPAGLETVVEHVFPLVPGEGWSGDGRRSWNDLTDDEQNSLRALAPTLGNLTLLEPELADAGIGRAFPELAPILRRSAIEQSRAIAELPAWNSTAIGDRSGRLAAEFVRGWPRAAAVAIDDDGLTPILDAVRRPGWYPGWRAEFDYVEYRGEHWEVYDYPHLFRRIFARLWADRPDEVLAFSERHRGPVFDAKAWSGEWAPLGDTHFLFLGLFPELMLEALQGVLAELGIADEVFVVYPPGGVAVPHDH